MSLIKSEPSPATFETSRAINHIKEMNECNVFTNNSQERCLM